MPQKKTTQQQSVFGLVISGTIALSILAQYAGYPGITVGLLGMVLAIALEPPLTLTGKDAQGNPVPNTPAEEADQKRRQFISYFVKGAFIPLVDVRKLSWWIAAGLILASCGLGVWGGIEGTLDSFAPYWYVNPLSCYILAAGIIKAIHADFPGVNFGWPKVKPFLLLVPVSAALAFAGTTFLSPYTPWADPERWRYACLGLSIVAAAAVWISLVRGPQMEEFVANREASQRWASMFSSIFPKQTPPRVSFHRLYGNVTVDRLEMGTMLSADEVIRETTRLSAYVPDGRLTLLHVRQTDRDGQPIPGVMAPTTVYAVISPYDYKVDLSPEMDEEAFFIFLSLALAFGVDSYMGKSAPDKRIIPSPVRMLNKTTEEQEKKQWYKKVFSRDEDAWWRTFVVTDEEDDDRDEDEGGSNPEEFGLIQAISGIPRKKLLTKNPKSPWNDDESDTEKQDIDVEPTMPPEPEVVRGLWAVGLSTTGGSDELSNVSMWYNDLIAATLSQEFVCDSLVTNSMIVGDFGAQLDNGAPDIRAIRSYMGRSRSLMNDFVDRVRQTSEWDTRWMSVKQVSSVPPNAEWGTFKTEQLGKATLNQMGFVTRNGIDPKQFEGIDGELAATLLGAPFVAVTAFPAKGQGPGSRHNQALMVTWSHDVVPTNPQNILPAKKGRADVYSAFATDRFPEHWILAGLVSKAFQAVKLPRGETVKCRPLAERNARKQCWQITIRLYGGVSLSMVRHKLQAIKSQFGCEWIAVKEGNGADEICLVAGASFGTFKLANESDETWLTDLAWQQTFEAAGLASKTTGTLPRTLHAETLPRNEAIRKVTFELPPGVALEDVIKKKGAIEKTAGLAFTMWDTDPDNPRNVIALTSTDNPMPDSVPYDMEWADENKEVVGLGVGIDGEVISWNPQDDPHVLLVGLTGSGKAISHDTLVRTKRGWIPNENLCLEDVVYDEDGEEEAIDTFSDWMDSEAWTVHFDNGTTVTTDARHLWKVTRGNIAEIERDFLAAGHAWRIARQNRHQVASLSMIADMLRTNEAELADFRLGSTYALRQSSNIGTLYCVDQLMGWMREHPSTIGGYEMTDLHLSDLGLSGQWIDEEALAHVITPVIDRSTLRQILLLSGTTSRLGRTWNVEHLYFVDEVASSYAKAKKRGGYYPSRVLTTREIALESGLHVSTAGGLRAITRVTTSGSTRTRCLRVSSPTHMFTVQGGIPTHNSASVQGIIYGCLANGWDVAVADPNKGGVDFQPFRPWLSAFVNTKQSEGGRAETAAMLESVYGEVQRRVSLNAQYSAANFLELPQDVRPRRLIVVLDEFNSLIKAPKPSKPLPGAPPEAIAAYSAQLAESTAVSYIGTYAADIAAQARSAGVSLILMGQQLKSKDLDPIPGANGIRTNMTRVLLGNSTFGDKQGALRAPESAPDLGAYIPHGRGYFESTRESSARIIQFWYSHPPKEVYPTALSERRDEGAWQIEYHVRKELAEPVVEGQVISTVTQDLGQLSLDWGEDPDMDEPETPAGETVSDGEPEMPDSFAGAVYSDKPTDLDADQILEEENGDLGPEPEPEPPVEDDDDFGWDDFDLPNVRRDSAAQ